VESASREGWITSGGLRLFHRAWGDDPTAPGVAILHGLGDHSGRWERVGRTLSSRGFNAYALDLPGHGRSEGRRGHVRAWDEYRAAVTDWLAVIRQDGPPRRWAFFAHSMGALVALDWVIGHPGVADALVLSAPPFELSLHPAAIKVHAARILGLLRPGFTQGNEIPPSLLSHDPEVIRAHRADPYVHYRISARLFLELTSIRRALSRAGSPTIPILLIQGQSDPVTSCAGCAQWARGKSTVTYREYAGLYHEVLNEREGPAILNEVVDWLTAVLVPAPAR